MSNRKIESGRYFKRNGFCLDHDGSKYTNGYEVTDGEKPTGIRISDSGDSAVSGSNKRTVLYRGEEYPSLKAAVIAYEDAVPLK